ncbi:hypothetical protein [Thiomonas sp.]
MNTNTEIADFPAVDFSDAHAIRCALFETREAYLAMRAAWRAALSDPARKAQVGPEAHALYALFRGVSPVTGFSPVQSAVKLANGRRPRDTLGAILRQFQGWRLRGGWVYSGRVLDACALFGPTVGSEQLVKLRPWLEQIRTSSVMG